MPARLLLRQSSAKPLADDRIERSIAPEGAHRRRHGEPKHLKHYSAKLLFQFRVSVNGSSGKRRICEERIILISAPSAKDALREAKREGKVAQYGYRNSDGNMVRFELVGVLDLLSRNVKSAPKEVWYDIVQRVEPMERKKSLVPTFHELNAIQEESLQKARQRVRRAGRR